MNWQKLNHYLKLYLFLQAIKILDVNQYYMIIWDHELTDIAKECLPNLRVI